MVLNLMGVGKYQLLGDRLSLIIEFPPRGEEG